MKHALVLCGLVLSARSALALAPAAPSASEDEKKLLVDKDWLELVPWPASFSTRTETRLASGAMPASRPAAEYAPLPTMIPATCVPWPWGSTLVVAANEGS